MKKEVERLSENSPLVSVIMPAHNAEKYIRESINSILQQTYSNYELIIINDGSSDSTEEVIMEFQDERIILVNNSENLGVAKSLNKGLRIANGKYIMRLDSDDLAYPYRMEKQVQYLEKNTSVYVLGGGMLAFGEGIDEYLMIPACNSEQLKIDSLFFCPISHPSVMFRKSLIDEGYFYDFRYEKIEDYELWVRIMKKYQIAAIEDVLVKYRIHPKQVTQKSSYEMSEYVRELHNRQLERFIDYDDSNWSGFNYTQKTNNIEELRKKQNFFAMLLNNELFLEEYNEKLCKQHFYMVVRNELFALEISKAKKIKTIFQLGMRWNKEIKDTIFDVLRILYK